MKEQYYLIGEVSKITGISKDTLHFYSKTGLLVPDYIDETNQYRYYSRFNLWQLDIICTCRKLSVPLEKVKQILDLHDNAQITQLLLDYRNEALRLSAYYSQVADDILWYDQESLRIPAGNAQSDVKLQWFDEETVIAGLPAEDLHSYHANMQEASRDELQYAETIQRKYGYILDLKQILEGQVCKCREYLKIPNCTYSHVRPEHLYTIPAGLYASGLLHIVNDTADFTHFLRCLQENGRTAAAVYADEMGLQLFDYINDYYCEVRILLEPQTECSCIIKKHIQK